MTKEELLEGMAKLLAEFEDTNPEFLNHAICVLELGNEGGSFAFNGDSMTPIETSYFPA